MSVVAALGVAAPGWARDLARDRLASASSWERGLAQYAPKNANDGNSATRWSSAYSDNQWWQVDLGVDDRGLDPTINRVALNWEAAYASRYRIQTRTSRSNSWSRAATVSIGRSGWKVTTFDARPARYVRIRGDVRATPWGISLWDARVCDNDPCGPEPTPPPSTDPAPTPTQTPPPAATPTSTPTAVPPPAGAPTLQQVDGGTGYYGQFSNALPTDPGFFPIGVWGAYNLTQANIDLDRGAGLNTYVWLGGNPPEDGALARLRASGMYAMLSNPSGYPSRGSETVAWSLGDEPDMSDDSADGCPNSLNVNLARFPADSRMRFTNFGKGLALPGANPDATRPWRGDGTNGNWWSSTAEQRCFANGVDLASNDYYHFTDPWDASFCCAYEYGNNVTNLRNADASDGRMHPNWGFVESGEPWGPNDPNPKRSITPAEMRAAVWHSIIAGARGIIYFQHSFGDGTGGGSCTGDHHTLRTNCEGTRPMATSVNAQIKSLAPVLNAPSVTSQTTTSSGVRALYKWHDGHFYVFAGNRENVSTTGTMGLSCVGDATAVKLGEDGERIPVVTGTFMDEFDSGTAVHVYRIDGGSRCGL